MKYIPELDGLREIAAASVVGLHWAPQHFFWGWSGVNLFFFLSGYLIGTIVLEAVMEQRFSAVQFYYRRTLRIWPVYYFSLVMILAYHLLTKGPEFFDTAYFSDWLRSLLFLQFTPFYFEPGVDPFEIFNFLPGMLPVWSLAVEEQFYLIMPWLLVFLVPKIGLKKLIWLLLVIALVAQIMRLKGYVPILLVTQLDGLMLGVVLAALMQRDKASGYMDGSRGVKVTFFVSLAASAFVIVPYLVIGYQETPGPEHFFGHPFLPSWFNLFYFGLVGILVMSSGRPLFSGLRSRTMIYLGSISYAIYMFHFPILAFVKPRLVGWLGPELYWLAILLTLFLIIFLPHMSRQYLERPFLRLKNVPIFGKRAHLKSEAMR